MTYRNEEEQLRARVLALEVEKETLESRAGWLTRAHNSAMALVGQQRPWWHLAFWFAFGSIATQAIFGLAWATAAPHGDTSPPETEALVIHDARCYRAHDLDFYDHGMQWFTSRGTRMRAAYENVAVVYPRDTSANGWQDAYDDARILGESDCP